MAYALETKKRKFDRILESLTEGAAGQSRTQLNTHNNATTPVVDDRASDASKKRRITPSLISNISKNASNSSLTGHYLPSSRTAFLERLETFRGVTTWHIPSTESINAAEWAKRGWTCVDTDIVQCGSCKERLRIDINLDSDIRPKEDVNEEGHVNVESQIDSEDNYIVAKEIYEGVVKRYRDMIVTAHGQNCPWRRRGGDASIQRIEGLLNASNAVSALESRYEGIVSDVEELPEVEQLPETSHVHDSDLHGFKLEGQQTLAINALRLAICGWQKKIDDVLECKHCFRSLGLWLYRGDTPTMGKLDAVESHLEYCPWRSPIAQDTEVKTSPQPGTDAERAKEKLAGWVLVYQALAKHNAKRANSAKSAPTASAEYNRPMDSESITPEQREKKLKDLIRRIKEIKKPFNVKALLRKRDKVKA